MDFSYLITPLIAYLVAGTLKFLINSIKAKRLAFSQLGLGGLPSTHTSIVTAVATVIAFKQGLLSSQFAIMLSFTMIVIIDAMDLRRKVGHQAKLLNDLAKQMQMDVVLRERMGHSFLEVLTGVVVGIVCGMLVVKL